MMLQYPRWKQCLLLSIVVLGGIYALPNLFPEQPVLQISPPPTAALATGLAQTQLSERVQQALKKVQFQPIAQHIDRRHLTLQFQEVDMQLKAKDVLMADLGGSYTVSVNLMPTTPVWLQALGATPMKLGLDLRGGVHFVLAVAVEDLQKAHLENLLQSVKARLQAAKIPFLSAETQAQKIRFTFKQSATLQAARGLLVQHFPEVQRVIQTVDDQPTLQLQLFPHAHHSLQQRAVEQTMATLRNRVNELGIAEPIIQQQGTDRIIVDLPGVQDMTRAQQILGGTATVEFRFVDTVSLSGKSYAYQSQSILLHPQVVLTGTAITDAAAQFDETGRPTVGITLGRDSERYFHQLTREHIGRLLAIVYTETRLNTKMVKGQAIRSPRKHERIISVARIASALGHQFQITGLAETEAQHLALLLRAGALPTPIYLVEQTTIGPQLGAENIRMGLSAIVGGFLLAALFMGVYYRRLGWIANLTLFVNLVLLVALLSLLGMTLTLPGMAGILLTVALAVDAQVLIFERIREELRRGTSPRSSIVIGYTRAWTTILDANVTTLIVASSLFFIGSGAIRGFAVTLAAGIMTSLFTAVSLSRLLVNRLYGTRIMKTLSIGL